MTEHTLHTRDATLAESMGYWQSIGSSNQFRAISSAEDRPLPTRKAASSILPSPTAGSRAEPAISPSAPHFLSICSGIEAASMAWDGLMRPMLFSEIEAFPRAVLAARHGAIDARRGAGSGVPLWGDFTALRVRHLRRFGLPLPQGLIGGTPSQAVSVAGGGG